MTISYIDNGVHPKICSPEIEKCPFSTIFRAICTQTVQKWSKIWKIDLLFTPCIEQNFNDIIFASWSFKIHNSWLVNSRVTSHEFTSYGLRGSSEFHGHGSYNLANGTSYIGDFKNDLFNGFGEKRDKKGTKYEGEFKDSVYHGKGKLVLSSGVASLHWDHAVWPCYESKTVILVHL